MAKRRPPRTSPRTTELSDNPPDLAIPLPDDGIGSASFWDGELEDATRKMQDTIGEWKMNLSRYEGHKPPVRGFRPADAINVNVGFYSVENKKPQLFFTVPKVQAKALREDAKNVTPLVQAIVNRRLEGDDINAAELVGQVLDDCLITAGVGGSKVGYDEVSDTVQLPTGRTVPVLDPITQQPMIDPVTGQEARTLAIDEKTGQPETQPVKRVLWSRIYWQHIAPADLRFPVGFTGANFDAAPWLAWRFNVDANFAEQYGLDPNAGQAIQDDLTLLHELDRQKLMTCGTGYEIWYRAYLYDSAEKNPEKIRRLVIVGAQRRGKRRYSAIIHEDSPYQVFDPDGRFVTGMRGFPIHPLVVRPLTERVYPKSDCSVLRDVGDEKSLGRTLMIQQRKRNLPVRGFNKNSVDVESIKKLESAEVQEMIAFTGDPRDQLFQLPQSSFPPENFSFDRMIQEDIDRLSASGSNQQGLTSDAESATEASLIQRGSDNRVAKERERVLRWFVDGVTKVFALIQLFASDEDVAMVVGEDGLEQYRAWKRTEIQGRFAFSLKPDSSLRTNAADERNMYLRFFNLAANHPQADSTEMLRGLASAFGMDPAKVIKPPAPPPPPPPPEKPKLSIALKGEDLDPTMPQYANVITLLRLYDVEKGMSAPQPGAQPPGPSQPGTAPNAAPRGNSAGRRPIRAARGVPPVDQHDAELTHELPGPGPRM